MLEKLVFKAGSGVGQPPLQLPLGRVTVIVGPNNGGKSRALVEIERSLVDPNHPPGVVLANVEERAWTPGEIEAELNKITIPPNPGEIVPIDHVLVSRVRSDSGVGRVQLHKPGLVAEAAAPHAPNRHRFAQFASLFTFRLDGNRRLELANPQPAGELQGPPSNILATLFRDNATRARLRQFVFDAFGKYLVLDPTNVSQLRWRLASVAPKDEVEEKGLHEAAIAFHSRASLVSEASDGVKAFIGMLSTLIAGAPKVTLIDEPEAFLHPALCSRLGKDLVSIGATSAGQLILATHSASLLMGCVQGGAAVDIVRLTYDYSNATARLLGNDKLTHLMRNPLLRSVGVLNALFYSAVVVTEADADRAFYQEINERLLANKDPRGIDGCLFLNAQNKQTVWDIVKPLRELGIPAAGVVDIDVVKDGGAVWSNLLEGAFFPSPSHAGLHSDRDSAKKAFDRTGRDMKRDGGIDLLVDPDLEACKDLFDRLEQHGVFVVRRGEIERWLDGLAVNRSKGGWLVGIFEAMGEDPTAGGYVRPTPGDVWDFIGKIRSWVANGARKGIPA